MLYFMTACKGSKQIHVKKQIHQGSASSQGKRKNTYQSFHAVCSLRDLSDICVQ